LSSTTNAGSAAALTTTATIAAALASTAATLRVAQVDTQGDG
jgi:hypothetical protein